MSAKAILLNPATLAIGAGATAIVGGVGVPVVIRATMSPQEKDESALSLPEDPVQRTVLLGLREIAMDGGLVLRVEHGLGVGGAWVAFWTQDRRDPGALNTSELLVIAHNPLLQTITAHAAPERTPENDEAIDLGLATGGDLLRVVRARSDIDARILATGVSDMTLAWSGSMEGDGRLTFGLIWAPQLADSFPEREPSSVPSAFTVNLPGVLPAR